MSLADPYDDYSPSELRREFDDPQPPEPCFCGQKHCPVCRGEDPGMKPDRGDNDKLNSEGY